MVLLQGGVKNLKEILLFLGNNTKYGITVVDDNYVLEEIPEGFVLTKSLEMWSEKYAESIYDDQEIPDYEKDEYVDSFPESNSFSIKEYMQNEQLQDHIDNLLNLGLYLGVNKATRCFELYYEF